MQLQRNLTHRSPKGCKASLTHGLSMSACIRRSWAHSVVLTWKEQQQMLSLMRLRAQVLDLHHMKERRTRARTAMCIFCNEMVTDPTMHPLVFCKHWCAHREAMLCGAERNHGALSRIALEILDCRPKSLKFKTLLAWIEQAEKIERDFWRR